MTVFRVGDRVQYSRTDGVTLVGKVTDLCWMPEQIRTAPLQEPAGVAVAWTHADGDTALVGRETAHHRDDLEHID